MQTLKIRFATTDFKSAILNNQWDKIQNETTYQSKWAMIDFSTYLAT